jgi:uncharacterized RDD family membrane protein YckC
MEIGWWVKSSDEAVYGPVSRQTIWGYVDSGVLSADTLVRHCLSVEYAPLGEQPGLQGNPAGPGERSTLRDRIGEVWPSRRADAEALGDGSFRCLRHAQPASLVCMCCLGAYCSKCRVNRRKAFHYCKKCHAGLYNRRGGAFLLDSFIFRFVGYAVVLALTTQAAIAAKSTGTVPDIGGGLIFGAIGVPLLVFIFRDAIFRGAGPGKRLTGLRVVRAGQPEETVSYWGAFVRAIPSFIPFVNLLDLSVPYRDPLWRRWGDRWARTRVLFTPAALEQRRARAGEQMRQNVGEFLPLDPPAQEQLARLD